MMDDLCADFEQIMPIDEFSELEENTKLKNDYSSIKSKVSNLKCFVKKNFNDITDKKER